MAEGSKSVVWFKEVGKQDIPLVGGKGANLGELTSAGIPVPPGYIVTSGAYFKFLDEANLKETIAAKLAALTDSEDSKKLQEISADIKATISGAAMPSDIAEEIKKSYQEMGGGLVAVRSSATAEDLPEASFAGQQRTYLNVESDNEVVKAVQGCWASLFESRAIYYRVQQGPTDGTV
jgi:pyruvate,water dikinase